MANFEIPSGLDPKAQAEADDYVFSFRGSDGKPVRLTLAQFKIFIGSGMPDDFLSGGKIATKYLLAAKLSSIQFQQLTVNGVLQDIEHNMDWFNAAVRAVGQAEGWGTGTPSTPLGSPAISLGTITENSIAFSWTAVPNAASYDIYKAGVKIANISTTSYTSTGLTASTSYGHYVRAVPASGTSYTTGPASNTITASTTGATGLPTPTAPTVTFNSSARTLSATHSNYPNGLEKRYNGGAWENWPDTGSVYVGTDAVAANVYEWRVKAVSGVNLAGVVTANTAIAAAVVVTPGLTNVVAPQSINKMTFDASTATFTRNDSAAGAAPYSLLKERVLINSSTNAIIQWDEPATAGGQSLVLHTSSAYTNTPYLYFNRNPANPKVEAFVNINGGQWVTVEGYSEGAIKMRLVIAGLQITPQYSTDGGTNWIGSQSVTLPTGITLWAQVAEGANGTTMGNVKQSGYSIA
jgi:hypothetical protein